MKKDLLYSCLAIAFGLLISLVTGSTHLNALSFWLTAATAFGIVTAFDLLILATIQHRHMTPTRFLFRTMLMVVIMQAAFAGIYYFGADAATYLAKDGQRVTDFVDCLYFSGVTLMTVGYGDIVPVGDFRFTAVAEVYGGTLFVFAFFSWGLSTIRPRKS